MLNMDYMVTCGTWQSKQSYKIIHFNIKIKNRRHFLGSAWVCGSISLGSVFTKHRHSWIKTMSQTNNEIIYIAKLWLERKKIPPLNLLKNFIDLGPICLIGLNA